MHRLYYKIAIINIDNNPANRVVINYNNQMQMIWHYHI